MREILFRGKALRDGKWKEGGLFYPVQQEACIISTNEVTERMIFDFILFDVDPETVGQFTGLYDKNGKRIFEGDIVEKNGLRMYVVMYKGSWNLWDYDERDDFLRNWCSPHYLNGEQVGGCCVIGNIHDNPELLEE